MPDLQLRILVFLLTLTSLPATGSHAQIHYTISYLDSTAGRLKISIQPEKLLTTPMVFIMPRSIPGDYSVTKYDLFVDHLKAESPDGRTRPLTKNDLGAPRWSLDDSGFAIQRITYEVDLKKMDEQLHAASDKSIFRPGFAGLLNYSVLGWIEGFDRQPVSCTIRTFSSWPVFSTIVPTAFPAKGDLANSTTMAGWKPGAWRSSRIISATFPSPVIPRSSVRRSPFFGDTSHIITTAMTEDQMWKRMPSYLHHMAHAYIPLRCNGDAYRPYVLEIPPVINNIWFNEGFMWYIVADTLKSKGMIDLFRQTTYNSPPAIRQLTLQELSQIASTQYAEDFRLGTAVFSRGALMAMEINDYVKSQTNGKSSMRTIYRYLYEWSRQNRRPFTLQEFPDLMRSATGVDVSAIYNKWQAPVGNASSAY